MLLSGRGVGRVGRDHRRNRLTRGWELNTLGIVIGALVMVGAFTLGWRWACRRWSLPCPSLLAWTLDNSLVVQSPLMLKTVHRIGFRPGDKVLEIGPGPGRLLIPAARRVMPGGEVVGIDIQPKMIELLEARAKAAEITNLTTILGDATQPPCSRGELRSRLPLHDLGRDPGSFGCPGSVLRALKPGGRLSITELIPDPHYQTRSTVRRLAEEAGFRLLSIQGGWSFLYRQLRQAVEKRRLRHTDPTSGNGPESSIPTCRSKIILIYPPSVRRLDLRPFQKGHCTPTP